MTKLKPLMVIHFCLMAVLIVLNAIGLATFASLLSTSTGAILANAIMNIIMMLLIMVMLGFGILYLLNEYGKKGAIYYKVFLILQVIITIITILTDYLFAYMNVALIIRCILYIFKAFILLVLAFWKDLGKKKTWILFYVLLGIDLVALVIAIIYMASTAFNFTIISFITALVADGTLGLAIRGKYQDKEARGTN